MFPFPELHIPRALDARRARNLFIVGLTTILVLALAVAVDRVPGESGGIGGPAGHDPRTGRLRMAAGAAGRYRERRRISDWPRRLWVAAGRGGPNDRPRGLWVAAGRGGPNDRPRGLWVAAGRGRVTTAPTADLGFTTWPGGCARPLVVHRTRDRHPPHPPPGRTAIDGAYRRSARSALAATASSSSWRRARRGRSGSRGATRIGSPSNTRRRQNGSGTMCRSHRPLSRIAGRVATAHG